MRQAPARHNAIPSNEHTRKGTGHIRVIMQGIEAYTYGLAFEQVGRVHVHQGHIQCVANVLNSKNVQRP